MNQNIIRLNTELTKSILDACKDKEQHTILTTLTAGMDTRVILSILLKNGIKPHCMTHEASDKMGRYKDVKISQRITRDLQLVHTVINKQVRDKDYFEQLHAVSRNYDIVFYGEKMSEVFNKYTRITESEKKLNNLEYVGNVEFPNHIYPVANKKALDIVKDMPIYHRMCGYIQKRLIALNYKELLRYPHTYYNLKYVFAEKLHMMVVKD